MSALQVVSLILFIISWLICAGVCIAGLCGAFSKAGRPAWAAIVPIYNTIVFLDIAGKPWWWLFLLMLPLVGIVFAIMATIAFVANYGRGVGFAIGLMFLAPIFLPLLGFGDNEYRPEY
jgi:hypothetical protein